MEQSARISIWLPWMVIGYALLLLVVVAAMFKARHWAATRLSNPRVTTDWQQWREDVRQQQNEPGPVQRRVPKSTEPPSLVLMRDHFAVSLFGAVLFSSALYWVLAWFVKGIVGGPQLNT